MAPGVRLSAMGVLVREAMGANERLRNSSYKESISRMKAVLQHTMRRKLRYQQLPFFEFLRDDTLSARDRLSFYPCMAGFIMSFGDLNRYVLRDEPTTDAHQAMVNAHTHEDDHHWPWYLEDFEKLGFDVARRPTQLLRETFSEECVQNRLLAHRLAHLVWGAAPKVRLAVIEAIEETGNVLFELTAKLASQYQRATGVELRYLGDFHFRLESGHAMNNEHAALAAIELDDGAQRADALSRVDAVFEGFTAWTHELHAYARRRVDLRNAEAAQPAPMTA
jgi:hypothetical protein